MAKEWAKAFYKSQMWKDTRAYALKRDHYRCRDCGALAEEVHHETWLTKDNINDPNVSVNVDNLVSLCYKCHKNRHERKEKTICAVSSYRFAADGSILPPEG